MPHTMNRCFEIDEEGDIVTTVFDGVRRVAMIEGDQEIEQAFVLRFKTRRGEDDYFPEAGFPIDQIIGLFNSDYIAGKVRETLQQDPRVISVGVVLVDMDRANRIAGVSATVTIIGGEEVEVSATF